MKPLARWSVTNAPALNIVMLAIMVVGCVSLRNLRREQFPNFDLDMIQISVPYPGATPDEVEEGICLKIEEAVRSLEGVKKVTSVAAEGAGNVVLELDPGVRNPDRVLDEVRMEVDRIPSFPVESEDPRIRLVSMPQRVIRVGVLGPESASIEAKLQLREVAEGVRNEMLRLDDITQVEIVGAQSYQIDVEIPEETLRSYGLSLRRVAESIRRENRELSGGTMRGQSQEILLRGMNRRSTGDEIAKLPLVTRPGGEVLTVGDLGVVRDEFEDIAAISQVNGRPAQVLSVERTNNEDLFAIVDAVKKYESTAVLPDGYELITWSDQSVEVRGRLNMLLENGMIGLLLVFLLLAFFLDLRVAFWVALGIPFAVMVTGAALLFFGQTLNMISMFAFLMALGIVVDDAIVVSENVVAHRQMGKSYKQAAIDGTAEVIPSILAAVSTTIIAFMPMLFVAGIMGKFIAVMPAAVIAMLLASLMESVTILPCHLAHRESLLFRAIDTVFFAVRWVVYPVQWTNRWANRGVTQFVAGVYAPALKWALRNRLIVVAMIVGIQIVSFGCVRAGLIPFVIFPKLDGNTVQASIKLPDGTPTVVADRWTQHLEKSFWKVHDRYESKGMPIGKTSYRVVGEQVSQGGPGAIRASEASGGHVGSVEIELIDVEARGVSSEQIVTDWRQEAGPIPGAQELSFGAIQGGPAGIPIEFKLLASPAANDKLEQAVELAKRELLEFPGVFDVKDDSIPGKWEYRFRVKDEALSMGVTMGDLAETVRSAYYGEEVMRLQRGRHEVKLMVRYPREDRRDIADFEEIRLRTDDNTEHPITELAEIEVKRGYSEINRRNQRRSVTVSADLDESKGNARKIVAALQQDLVPKLSAEFPEVTVLWEGQQEQTQESVQSLFVGFGVAMLAMFVLLAFEFKSYLQPFLVLAIIPFGAIGAIMGHGLQGLPLTLFSMFGLVALTGIVVNDSIVLIDFINSRVRGGVPVGEAIVSAGQRRFRPVMLTTVTTVAGLAPILMETSLQAQLLVPMATSIAFGEIFATVVVLFLVPVSYSLLYEGSTGLRLSEELGESASDRQAPELIPDLPAAVSGQLAPPT